MHTEFDALKTEYVQLSTEATDRYTKLYQFHYLVFVIIGAMIALWSGEKVLPDVKLTVVLFLPLSLLPLTFLMLKEHAYSDLRLHYIAKVIRPKALAILGIKERTDTRRCTFLAWDEWQEKTIRSPGKRFWIYGIFGLGEYILPLLALMRQ